MCVCVYWAHVSTGLESNSFINLLIYFQYKTLQNSWHILQITDEIPQYFPLISALQLFSEGKRTPWQFIYSSQSPDIDQWLHFLFNLLKVLLPVEL